MGKYFKGIYNAVIGRSYSSDDFQCAPVSDDDIDLEGFNSRISTEYADVLEVLAE